MRRVVSRTLMVLGGAIATTAAAWAISGSTATADTLDLPTPGIERIDSVLPADAPVRIKDLTDAIGRIIGEPDPAFGERAKAAFDEVGREITERFDVTPTLPIDQIDDVADVELPSTTLPGDTADHGPAVGVVTAQPIASATTLVGVRPGAIDQNTVAGAQERALSDGMSRRGSPETSDEAPAQPTGPSPLAPLSFPAPVGSGHTGTGSVDAPSFGLLSSVPSGTDLNTADAPRSAQVHLPVAVGAQPGVTPD
ncbi:hypothetical protein [Actinokineospora sp. HUAS TT18]|uniref:hypothetical protein n=1 Tax=Actinokineospora sp. HUAS TT18 TaxID=3447451 RepID=UPI003F5285A0